jgi:F-type H+-transporting ATPase subunit epsilon
MSEDVHMVVVPGTEGQSGIMAGHAPYMTVLRDGDEIAVYRPPAPSPRATIPVSGGFAEVGRSRNGLNASSPKRRAAPR